MNTRDYSRIAHAIRMARSDAGDGMADWDKQDGIDLVARRIADMLAGDTVANRGFDWESFIDSTSYSTTFAGQPGHVVEPDLPPYEHTHYSVEDGSDAQFVSLGSKGWMTLRNECGDEFQGHVSQWQPVTP